MTMAKKLLWTVLSITLVVTLLLIAVRQYYVAAALFLGIIIMWHREIWSLLTRRRMPPADERVKENTNRAIRNGFIFFAAATAFLMMPFGEIVTDRLDTSHTLGALFLSSGLVYMLSYLFYDRAGVEIPPKRMKLIKTFLIIGVMSLPTFIIGVFMHSALSALFNVEEPVFFVIAVIVAPAVLVVGLIGSLVLLFMGMFIRSS
jgi:hypothetical protein